MAQIQLRFWAGAETAAGTSVETHTARTPREALDAARAARADTAAAPEFERVLAVSSYLVDGRRLDAADLDEPADGGADGGADTLVLEVLPPFAGG